MSGERGVLYLEEAELLAGVEDGPADLVAGAGEVDDGERDGGGGRRRALVGREDEAVRERLVGRRRGQQLVLHRALSLSLSPSAGALATSGRIGRGAREIGERKSEGRARQRLTNSRSTRGGKKIALKAEKSRCALAFSSLGRSAQIPFAASSTADASYGLLYLGGPHGCSPHVDVAPAGGEPTCCCPRCARRRAAVRQSADSRPRRERCRPPSN